MRYLHACATTSPGLDLKAVVHPPLPYKQKRVQICRAFQGKLQVGCNRG